MFFYFYISIQTSLLGAKTMLIATVSPATCNLTESEQTLRFAEGAKQMRKNVKRILFAFANFLYI